MTITVRVATEPDVDAACQVLRRSITELCISDHKNDEQILAGWLKNKEPLFDVFMWNRIYENYARQFLDPDQRDEVDVTKIPGYVPPPAH